MTFDFQSYLASIRTTYAKWWEYYTLTDATGKQRQSREDSPFFDFGLMVQTVKREERDRQTEEKVERFSVLDGLRKYADQQVLLIGRPGSGKSTALARLMLEEATNQQARIPVLVELRYWQGSIEQLIRDSLIRHDMPAEQVEAALKNALILFDGVNELPSEEARSQLSAFRRNHPKLPMIFTTRDLSIGGDLGIEKKLEMQPLSEDQMREFVRAYVPEQAEQMLRQLKDRLRELGQTPLLLWMLCSLFRQTGTIPENLGLVFREFTQGYERQLKDDVRIESDKAWWKPVLQQLAWVMMQGEKPTEFRVAIRFEEAVGAIAQFLEQKVPYAEDFARKCLRDLQKHHLIQVGTNQEELEFRHQLIQEYYVAECLLKRLPTLSDDEIQQNYLNYLNKTEPLALMLALVEDEALAMRVVRLALEVDLFLGARLAGEVKLEFQKKTVGFVEELKVPDWLKVELLGRTRSNYAVSALSQFVEDEDDDLLRRVVNSLGKTASDAAIPALLKLVDVDDCYVCWDAVSALGEIGSDVAISELLQLVDHDDYYVRGSLAETLSGIESDMAIDALLELSEDCIPDVAWSATQALIKIAPEAVIPALLNIIEYNCDLDNSFAVGIAAEVLGNLGIKQAIPALFKLIEDDDSFVRSNAVKALGKLGMPLFNFIEDDSYGQLETSGLISFIKSDDSNDFSAQTGAAALGQNGNETTIPGLLQLAAHADFNRRWKAAEALGKIGNEVAIDGLLKLLEDADSSVRWSAAEALGEIAQKRPDTIAQHLLHLLTLIPTDSGQIALRVTLAIQENCKYYNYEIYQAHLEAQKHDRQTPQNSDRSSTTYYIENNYGNLNTGTVNIAGDQTGVESSIPNNDRASPNSFCD